MLQAVELRWKDGKSFGDLLHPTGNIQEDKMKKVLEMALNSKHFQQHRAWCGQQTSRTYTEGGNLVGQIKAL